MYIKIQVDRLDENGRPWRTSTFYRCPDEVEPKMERIRRRFRASTTRITVDGVVQA